MQVPVVPRVPYRPAFKYRGIVASPPITIVHILNDLFAVVSGMALTSPANMREVPCSTVGSYQSWAFLPVVSPIGSIENPS
eukprot:3660619-Pyramimonas_sp.AAC.1